MFNDLQKSNSPHASVDDIFAETDRTPEKASNSVSDIETHRAGLVSAGENEVIVEDPIKTKRGGKWFKIIIILIVAVIIILGGYLVYDKFFAATEEIELTTTIPNANTVKNSSPTSETVVTVFQEEEEEESITPDVPDVTIIPDIPGVNIPSENATNTEITPVVTPPIDSDGDGLTDDEEQLAGTNINIIDTDNDGLSDYEEIKIYHTNPLNADSDADGYLDGVEVQNGYNPNGPGKLPGLTPVNP